MKEITIITSEHCSPCKLAKGFLNSHSIPFTDIDIEDVLNKINSIPTILCKEDDIIKYQFEGFSMGIGNKIEKWFNKEA